MYSASSSRHHSSSVTSDIVAQCQTDERTVGGQHRPEHFVTPMLLCRFVDHPNPPAALSYEQAARLCLSVRDRVSTADESESDRRLLVGRVRARHHSGGGPVPMLPPVPVSRKRKKKTSGSSGRPSARSRSPMSQPGSGVAAPARDDRELARVFQGLAAYRDQVHRQRESRAATMATDLIADLARAVVDQPDIVVSDAVCERLGALLAEDERSPLDVRSARMTWPRPRWRRPRLPSWRR
jgi:hypothetical protein